MCVCIYIYIYIYIYMYVCICVYACMCVCVYMYGTMGLKAHLTKKYNCRNIYIYVVLNINGATDFFFVKINSCCLFCLKIL